MSADPSYVFPATHADRGAEKTNSGRIPEGALLMLPPQFDVQRIAHPRLRKVAQTLKVFGAYVVDRNDGAPFSIYVENGAGFGLHKPVWSPTVARDLDRIRAALRPVVQVQGWLDGHGQPMQMQRDLNLLSMRGPWQAPNGGAAAGRFDSWRQAVVFPAGSAVTVQSNARGNSLHPVRWALPKPGDGYRLTAHAGPGGSLRLQLFDDRSQRTRLFDSGELADGQSVLFTWPAGQGAVALTVRGGGHAQETEVSGTLVAADVPPSARDR